MNKKKYLLSELYPALIKDWDYEKNGSHKLDEFKKSEKNRFHWKCHKCGYQWTASIYARTRQEHITCPRCERARRKGTKKLADGTISRTLLSIGNPTLADEWNYEKNGVLTPENVTCNTNRKVWWHCKSCGHDWEASIANRNRGAGCPVCKHQILISGKNDLATEHPDIAIEWNMERNQGITANQVLAGGHKKYWWKCCHCGYEWQAEIIARIRGNGCPNCTFSLHTSLPEQIILYYLSKELPDIQNAYRPLWLNGREIDIFIPSLMIGIEYDGGGWHQDIQKDVDKSLLIAEHGITLIRIREPKCPEIDDKSIKIITGTPDNHFKYLDLALRELFIILSKYTTHIIQYNGCVMDDYMVVLGSLASKRLEASAATLDCIDEWDYEKNKGVNPSMLPSRSNRRVWWKCKKCGYSWQATVDHRYSGYGCARCAGEVVWPGHNDLKFMRPDLLKIWDWDNNIIQPDQIMPGSHRKVYWKCATCGYQWLAPVYSVAAGHGCPRCAGQVVWPGHNDLLSQYPELSKEWDYEKNEKTPDTVTAYTSKKAWWICHKCGYSWNASIGGRAAGRNCPACANRVLWPGHNDLATKYPALVTEWDYEKNNIDPGEVGTGSSYKAWWKCKRCGHSWNCKVISRTRGSGCPKCNQHGKPKIQE